MVSQRSVSAFRRFRPAELGISINMDAVEKHTGERFGSARATRRKKVWSE